jgi:hypothetical protein
LSGFVRRSTQQGRKKIVTNSLRGTLLGESLDMPNNSQDSQQGNTDFIKATTLYREFQAEREEILRHKWFESEKAGYDIGFERALTDWIIKHRAKWRRARQQEQAA